MITKQDKNKARVRRHLRVRKKIEGTAVRPRLNVFRSSKHIYAQLIDDVAGVTLVSASTMDKELSSEIKNGGSVEANFVKLANSLLNVRKKKAMLTSYLTVVDTCIMDGFKLWLMQLAKQALNSKTFLKRRLTTCV